MSRANVTVLGFWGCLAVAAWLPSRLAATEAGDLCAAGANPCSVTTAIVVDDLSIIDVRPRDLVVEAGGSLSVGTGKMTIRARQLSVAPASTNPSRPAGALLAQGTLSLDGGAITVEADEITIAGRIEVNGSSGGTLILRSSGTLSVSGVISADSRSSEGVGGTIEMIATTASVDGKVTGVGLSSGSGGDVSIQATGDVSLSGTVDTKGGDGGDVELVAGFGTGSGNLLLTDTSAVDASGKVEGFGGNVDLAAGGDGAVSGHVTMNGTIVADGGSIGTTGGDGGLISVAATGDVIAENKSAGLSVQGGQPDGFGGGIDITTEHGVVNSVAAIDIGTLGVGASAGGGDLSVDAAGDVTVRGPIDGKGGSDVTIASSSGGVTVTKTASIDAGEGGSISLETGPVGSGAPERVVVAGSLTANGGSIDLTGKDAVEVSGNLTADGPSAGGEGGSISLIADDGPVLVNATLSAKAKGTGAVGGDLSIDAGTVLDVEGRLDASGTGGSGGDIGLLAVGQVVVSGNLLAATTGSGPGGRITVTSSAADVDISGVLTSSGGPEAGGVGGINTVDGCTVTVEPSGQLQSLRPNGINRITGRAATLVFGSVQADAATGHNEFRYNVGGSPFFNAGSSVIPDPTLHADLSLKQCAECGDGQPEAPETCDDGNQIDGDGCSRDCQIEIPGDANANGIVDSGDPDALIEEIFDGDGDDVVMVMSPDGTFPGGAGADANGDKRITAADLTATVLLLVNPQP